MTPVNTPVTPDAPIHSKVATRLRHHLPVWITLIAGAALSVGAFVLVRNWEAERVGREFEWRVQSRVHALQTTLRGYEESLYAMRDLYDSSDDVTISEFRRTAEDLRSRHPGIQSLQWLPRIADGARAGFEARAREEVDEHYQIKQGRGPYPEHLDPAEPREEYLPILYVDPLAGIVKQEQRVLRADLGQAL